MMFFIIIVKNNLNNIEKNRKLMQGDIIDDNIQFLNSITTKDKNEKNKEKADEIAQNLRKTNDFYKKLRLEIEDMAENNNAETDFDIKKKAFELEKKVKRNKDHLDNINSQSEDKKSLNKEILKLIKECDEIIRNEENLSEKEKEELLSKKMRKMQQVTNLFFFHHEKIIESVDKVKKNQLKIIKMYAKSNDENNKMLETLNSQKINELMVFITDNLIKKSERINDGYILKAERLNENVEKKISKLDNINSSLESLLKKEQEKVRKLEELFKKDELKNSNKSKEELKIDEKKGFLMKVVEKLGFYKKDKNEIDKKNNIINSKISFFIVFIVITSIILFFIYFGKKIKGKIFKKNKKLITDSIKV